MVNSGEYGNSGIILVIIILVGGLEPWNFMMFHILGIS